MHTQKYHHWILWMYFDAKLQLKMKIMVAVAAMGIELQVYLKSAPHLVFNLL